MLRVVVADEDEKEDHHTETRHDEEVLETDQRKELEETLLTFTMLSILPLEESISCNTQSILEITSEIEGPAAYRVSNLLEPGIIRVFHSPWSSPIVPVRKKEGSIRLCMDFRRINQVTLQDPHLMPRVDDILYSF